MSLVFKFTPFSLANTSTQLAFETKHTRTGQNQQYPSRPAEFPDLPNNNYTMRSMLPLLNLIITQKESASFLRPVDPIIDEAPNYHEIIKRPIDLSTIRQKANNREYLTFQIFLNDLKLLIENATKFNPETHIVHQQAIRLSIFITEKLWQMKNMPNSPIVDPENEKKLEKDSDQRIADALKELTEIKRQRKLQNERLQKEKHKPHSQTSIRSKITFSEHDLSVIERDIRDLKSNALIGVIEILENRKFQTNMLPYKIDLRKYNDDVLSELEKYVKSTRTANSYVSYIWRPAIPDDLKEIQSKYSAELMNWLSPPPENH
ncbi:Bromodomain containing protein [Tritrichomonas foetus]|uniref:Bromodomain containing protein n=1 Tax=Tritrichomonas foetus TaxID=1144522 RepID=A0A1J4JEH4_9EUKA|nr:Bromodomain containing protein [Tritrichomonas foetus]|eukprot:OHS97562.1 Bromodomain containing protein [Tritrichomonas foetus]